MEPRLLLVDDEQAILNMLQIVLEKEGFREVLTARTGEEGIRICKQFPPDLVILDIMLPDMDGFEVCRIMREQTHVPILFLTARSNDLDKLMGLGIGGDDYITKPFNPLEVAARVKAQLRRQQLVGQSLTQEEERRIYDFGRFLVNEKSGQLIVEGKTVSCPAREFQLLCFLSRHANQIFSKGQLYERVWGEESFGDDNTVMVHIRRLREKIEQEPGKPRYLQTVRGLGYKLVQPGEMTEWV
ncbi:response regulator transcription factor [Kroppenstedtia pulmonis]|uniref:Response regulator transcription factor n=1 Tax=Kroppenstedtia pulmonis TaxID=1380685 RepID=A0A7D4CDE9_9BACL|nr:response regulator transcription factor [Kroppenstedtia pulmonis]QKG83354.1 response regulator transcription factor [Kroppenstedtia pulmonis]